MGQNYRSPIEVQPTFLLTAPSPPSASPPLVAPTWLPCGRSASGTHLCSRATGCTEPRASRRDASAKPVLALGRAVGGGGGRRRRTTMGLIARRWQWHTVGKRWCSICMFSPPDIVKQNQRCSALPCRNHHLCSEPCATPRQRRECDGRTSPKSCAVTIWWR